MITIIIDCDGCNGTYGGTLDILLILNVHTPPIFINPSEIVMYQVTGKIIQNLETICELCHLTIL